jgi:regulatory protein
LNDESFARDYASSRAQEQSCGPLKIEEDLKRKGIAQAIIARVLRETFGGGNEAEMARACLQKRFKNENLSEPKVARRAAAFLQRRGYTGEVITDLIKCPVGDI